DAGSDEEYDELQKDRNVVRSEIALLEVEIRSVGRVVNLPTIHQLEASVQRITNGPEPKTYDERRDVLEGLQDFRVEFNSRTGWATITGKVPVGSESGKNCEPAVDPNSERQGDDNNGRESGRLSQSA